MSQSHQDHAELRKNLDSIVEVFLPNAILAADPESANIALRAMELRAKLLMGPG